MPMERTITALLLSEYDRLRWRKKLQNLYKENGDWMVYALPPCIILSSDNHFDEKTDIGDGCYHVEGKTICSDSAVILRAEGTLPSYSDENAGLFITADRTRNYDFSSDTVKADTLALIMVNDEENSFRILRTRPLKTDR